MPVESRDDLVKQLQRRTQRCGTEHGIPVFERVPICIEAATRIESDAKRIAELEAERDAFQRVALDRLDKLTKAERALAEERDKHQWRTIESAPKDGQLLLAAYIVPSDEARRNGSRPFWDIAIGRAYGTKLDRWSGILGTLPSHWMPKPTPPDATAIRSGKPDGKE